MELLDQLLLLGNVDGGIKAVTTYLGIYQTVTRGRELGLYSSLAACFLLKFVTVVCTLFLFVFAILCFLYCLLEGLLHMRCALHSG